MAAEVEAVAGDDTSRDAAPIDPAYVALKAALPHLWTGSSAGVAHGLGAK